MKKHRKRKYLPRRLSILLILVVTAIGALLLCGSGDEKGAAYMIAQNGVISSTLDADGLFLYKETVINTDAAGTFSAGFCDGDKIAVGETAGELKLLNDLGGDPVTVVKSPVAGVFSSAVDGWETMLTVENVKNLDLAEVFKTYEAPKKQISNFIRQGQPCFKVMDNKEDVYLLVTLKATCLTADTITVRLCGEEVNAKVVFTKAYGGEYYGLLALSPLDAYFQSREVSAKLVLNAQEGVVVTSSAVTKRYGEAGVYLVEGGNLRFCPVTVVAEEDANVLVEGVEEGDCILCDVN